MAPSSGNSSGRQPEDAILYVAGVAGITNRIRLSPRLDARDVHSTTEGAVVRQIGATANRVCVEADDGRIDVRRGTVRPWWPRRR